MEQKFWGDKGLLDVTCFKNELRNMIAWETISGWPVFTGRYVNRSMAYTDANAYRRSRLEEFLVGNHTAKPRVVEAGEEFSACATLFGVEESPEETAARKLVLEHAPGGLLTVRMDGGIIVAANLGSEKVTGEAFGEPVRLEPLEVRVDKPALQRPD